VARFDILSVAYTGKASDLSAVTINGNLTIRGITQKISFQAKIETCSAGNFLASADISINRRDWQIATSDFRYNTFIKTTIQLHLLIKAAVS
jgi:polyisoprenoid-binding protein YceI